MTNEINERPPALDISNDPVPNPTPDDHGIICASMTTLVTIQLPKPSCESHLAKFCLRNTRSRLEIIGSLHEGGCAQTVRTVCGKVLLEACRQGSTIRIRDLRDGSTLTLRRRESKKRDGISAVLLRGTECTVSLRGNVMASRIVVNDEWFGLRLAVLRRGFSNAFRLGSGSQSPSGGPFRIKVLPGADVPLMILLGFAFDGLIAGTV